MALLLLAAAVSTACRKPPPGVVLTPLEEPTPDEVEMVVFLIGDAGEATPGRSPVLAHLRRDVEAWSAGLGRDSAVSVLYLGDVVYPSGIREPTHPGYTADTLRLRSQLDVLAGPNARRFSATGYFMAGNHDWGNLRGPAGLERIRNMTEHIEKSREEGLLVEFLPDAGSPGPAVVDVRDWLRFVILDTHWWLQRQPEAEKRAFMEQVEEAMAGAGERHVVFAAHHPFASGGAHGGPLPIWEGLGVVWLLRQTGSLVQDLNSVVYRELLFGLKEIFARAGRPLVFAGGHDHSLQVLEDVSPDEPHWSVVSGAGSKLTDVAFVRGMRYGDDVPGYMRLTFLTDGRVYLHVEGTRPRFALCEVPEPELPRCMEEGLQAFETVFALRLN